MFGAAPFTVAKLWNQLRSPSTEEWIKKMFYIYYMYLLLYYVYVIYKWFYSAIKKDEIMSLA
jgi:hypothetical protein